MKKSKRAIKTFILIIVASFVILFYFQYDNVSALIKGLNRSSQDIAAEMDNNREKLKNEVKKYTTNIINDISSEDEHKLLKGEITVEDVANKYNLPLDYMKDPDENSNQEKIDNSKVNSKANETTGDLNAEVIPGDTANTKAIDDAISDGVSKMYALKAKYVNKLGELERKIYTEYTNLPKEKQNKDSKYLIVKKNLDYVSQLEEKCDVEVVKVLSTLKAELVKLNGDTGIIQILQDAYKKEKEVKKAYYLSLYNN